MVNSWKDIFKVDEDEDSFQLLQLPDEIIIEIFSLLNQVDVLSLMQTNKRLYQFGLEKLYRRIYLNGGSNYIKYAISSYTYTSFYLKYTIVKSVDKFINEIPTNKNAHLIKKVLSDGLEPSGFHTMTSLPGVTYEFDTDVGEMAYRNKQLVKSLVLRDENYRALKDHIGDNHCRELHISRWCNTASFEIIPKVTGLEILHVSAIQQIITGLKLNIHKLPLRELLLKSCKVKDDIFRDVPELFKLEMIETFGFDSIDDSIFGLPQIIPCLHNLKNLFLRGSGTTPYEAVKHFPSGLRFLCLHDISYSKIDFFDYGTVISAISAHEKSLTRLCLSSGIHHYMANHWIDKAYTFKFAEADKARNLHLIERILAGGRFPYLDTVILNEIYCFIKRRGSDVHIITV